MMYYYLNLHFQGQRVKVLFYPILTDFQKTECFSEGTQALSVCPSGKIKHVREDDYGALVE